jgi:diguanylate cyclase (GGDEF)-like protein/PAS domain S-box-containing protein
MPSPEQAPHPNSDWSRYRRYLLTALLLTLLLGALSQIQFLWFHTLSELVAIVIGFALYIVAANTYIFTRNNYLLLLAQGFFWVAGIDAIHTLLYSGIGLHGTGDTGAAMQLWFSARVLEAAILLLAPRYLAQRPLPGGSFVLLGAFATISMGVVYFGLFPVDIAEGSGSGGFETAGKSLVIALLLLAGLHTYRKRALLDTGLYRIILALIGLSILSESTFAHDRDTASLANLIGHLAKLWAFGLLLAAVSQWMLAHPFRLLARNAGSFEGMPIPVLLLDPDGVIQASNRSAREHIPGSDAGHSLHAIWHPKSRPIEECPVCRAIARGEVLRTELHDPESDEWARVSLQPIAQSGQLRGFICVHEDITQHKRADRSLQESEARLRTILDGAADGVFVIDREGRVNYANRQAQTLVGYDGRELRNRGITDLVPGEELEMALAAFNRVKQNGAERLELHLLQRSGERIPVEVNAVRLPDGTVYGACRDITRRREAEEKALANEQRYRALFDHMLEGFAYCKLLYQNGEPVDFVYLDVNAKFEELSGLHAVTGKRVSELLPGIRETNPELFERYGRVAATGEPERFESFLPGLGAWLLISVYSFEREHFVAVFDNITERKNYQAQLEHQATHDPLTGLANRTLLMDRVEQALVYARRRERQVAVVMLDLDRFKMVNDSMGHDTGDALLRQIAARISSCVRSGDTVARLGGDEFMLVLADMAEELDAVTLARSLLQAIEQPLSVGEREMFVTASLGIALYPRDGEDSTLLLRNADVAMFRAKELGRNTFQFYSPEMNERIVERLELEVGLRRALEHDELVLHYQPQVELEHGTVFGAEALVRWQHPERGMVPPAEFIPVAEESGLIIRIGEWVLDAACAQLRRWQESGKPPVRVAVNVSARQFQQGDIVEMVRRTLQRHRVPASQLELEVTESAVMTDPAHTVTVLRALKQIGVSISLDDFGTGYSSLNYLKRFPIDELKIDQSFVRDLTVDPDDAAIAISIITLAHSLRRRVIAEGVETEAQLAVLQRHNCDAIQGYLFARPMPAERFMELLASGKHLAVEPGGRKGNA